MGTVLEVLEYVLPYLPAREAAILSCTSVKCRKIVLRDKSARKMVESSRFIKSYVKSYPRLCPVSSILRFSQDSGCFVPKSLLQTRCCLDRGTYRFLEGSDLYKVAFEAQVREVEAAFEVSLRN